MSSTYKIRSTVFRRSDEAKADHQSSERNSSASYDRSAPLLSAEAECELAARIKAGDAAAREALTVANLGLVVTIARQFKARGVELDDLIQEGTLGLLRAAEDFDPETHGTRFSTYAQYWIRNALMRTTLDDGSMIHFPFYLATLRRRFDRVKAEMVSHRRSTADGPRGEPTDDEVAEHMGIEPRRLRFLPKTRVHCSSYSTSTLEVDDAGASEDQIFEERPPEKPLEIAEEMEGLHAALEQLPRFEAWLIKRRFRLDGDDDAPKRLPARPSAHGQDELKARRTRRAVDQFDEPRSYREIGRECGLPVYRLKQIERDAFQRLQRSLARASHSRRRLPVSSDPSARMVERRATA